MMMMSAKVRVFIDTNVLIQLHVATTSQHEDVTNAVKKLLLTGHELWISRQVLREYAATLTRHQPYTVKPLSSKEVSPQLRLFATNYRITDETGETSDQLFNLLELFEVGGKQIHYTNIVASMLNNKITRLFTLNTVDFVRYTPLISLMSLDSIQQDNP